MIGLVWSFVLGIIGVIGIWRAGSGKISGWMIGLSAQVLWFTYAIVTGQYGFLITAIGYGFVYARNLRRWYIQEERKRKGYVE